MTLSKVKTKVADKYGYRSWKEAMQDLDSDHMEILQYEVAEIYCLQDKKESLRVCRAITIMVILGMIIWACLWLIKVSNEPIPGERDYSGYGVYQDRRFR